MSKLEPRPPTTPFQRFTEFAKRVIAVPKAEIDEQQRLYRKRQKSKKRQKEGHHGAS